MSHIPLKGKDKLTPKENIKSRNQSKGANPASKQTDSNIDDSSAADQGRIQPVYNGLTKNSTGLLLEQSN